MVSTYWQENEIRFDVSSSCLMLTAGESLLEKFEPVEDSKANTGEPGCLVMTNLRLLWYSSKTAKLNLTIGYNCLTSISSQLMKGQILEVEKNSCSKTSLYLLAKGANGKYEFLFTPLESNNKLNCSDILNEIHRRYIVSKPFRELRLRHHIIHGKQLKVLPREQISDTVEGVWNLASNQGNLGCFIITNVRIVWFATMNECFNISLPYLQIAQFTVRNSKFGQVLVIESTENSGAYVLGFRIDPPNRLKHVLQEIQSLHSTQQRNPELGVSWNSADRNIHENHVAKNLDESKQDVAESFVNYLLGDLISNQQDYQCELDGNLGLAIEKLPVGLNRKTLWSFSL